MQESGLATFPWRYFKMTDDAVSVSKRLSPLVTTALWPKSGGQQGLGVPERFREKRKLVGEGSISVKPIENASEQPAFVAQHS